MTKLMFRGMEVVPAPPDSDIFDNKLSLVGVKKSRPSTPRSEPPRDGDPMSEARSTVEAFLRTLGSKDDKDQNPSGSTPSTSVESQDSQLSTDTPTAPAVPGKKKPQ